MGIQNAAQAKGRPRRRHIIDHKLWYLLELNCIKIGIQFFISIHNFPNLFILSLIHLRDVEHFLSLRANSTIIRFRLLVQSESWEMESQMNRMLVQRCLFISEFLEEPRKAFQWIILPSITYRA